MSRNRFPINDRIFACQRELDKLHSIDDLLEEESYEASINEDAYLCGKMSFKSQLIKRRSFRTQLRSFTYALKRLQYDCFNLDRDDRLPMVADMIREVEVMDENCERFMELAEDGF